MRVCYWGAYDRAYVRNRVMLAGLAQAGADVIECHAAVWRTPQERVREATRRGPRWRLAARFVAAYVRLSVRFFAIARPDVVIVGYPGQFDALVARLLCWARGVPLVFDAFLSAYETAVVDRGLLSAKSLRARLLWRVERLACRWADLVLLDTQADIDYFRQVYGVGNYARVWVGAEAPALIADTPQLAEGAGIFDVLWVGTFIPLHGVEHILHAARLLQDAAPDVRLTLIGSGQTYDAMRQLSDELGLTNIVWGPAWLDDAALTARTAHANLVLGVFGMSAKAQRVIPNKVYAALALGRPLLTADTPGIREALAPGDTAFLCPPGDPGALAEALMSIRARPDLAAQVASRGKALFDARFTPQAIGEQVLALLAPLTAGARRRASGW
jgi:glycosyltransferase involved in cell wall biosynthesis